MGKSLDQKNLTLENWPKSNTQKHFIVKGSFNEKVLSTVVAARTIIAGEPITDANVIYKKNFNSLNNFLKQGMRAMSIFLPSGTLGGEAFKADQTIDLNIILSKKGSKDSITQAALCNTRVLSIGQIT